LSPLTPPDGLLEVGRIGKPHGVRGDLFISLTSDVASRHAVGATFTIVDSSGQRTLTIDGIDDRNDAEKLTNKFLYAEPVESEDGLWVHQLIGSNVVDTEGESWGTCTGVLQNPAHDILEIEGGLLVPAPFIVSTDGTTTVINPPAGLREALSGE